MIFNLLLAMALQSPINLEIPTAVVNVSRLVAESSVGKAAGAQLMALQAEKQKVLSDKQAELQKLADSQAAPSQIERAQVELQRLTQDAESELASLDRKLRSDFEKKLRPVVAQIAAEDHIGVIFEYPQQLIVWAAPSIDITTKVIERLDAASKEQK